MVKSTENGFGHNPALQRKSNRARGRRVAIEGEVSARTVIVVDVLTQDAEKMSLAKSDDVVSALSSNRADDSFAIRVLPGALSTGDHLFNSHRLDVAPEEGAIDRVSVANEITRSTTRRLGSKSALTVSI